MRTKIDQHYLDGIRDNERVRQRLGFESSLWFSLLYLRHHFTSPLAPFHLEMFRLIEDPKYPMIVMMAFRGSGKSTVMNTANTLWSILGKPQKKLVVIMSQTQEQAKNHFANIKTELEQNELLKQDFGPFTDNQEFWNKLSLELVYHGAKIISITREQTVRGLKHGQFRPDLIICDDLEDSSAGQDRAVAEAFVRRFESEILPLGDVNTKIIVLGNLLSFYWGDPWIDGRTVILKLRDGIENGKLTGIVRAYPLIDDLGQNLWSAKFPNRQTVLKLRTKLSLETWIREYLLKSYAQNNVDGPNISFWSDPLTKAIVEDYPNAFNRKSYPKQKALIPQMKKFAIRAPEHAMHVFNSPDDSEYRRFLDDWYFYPNKEDLEKRIAGDREYYRP